MMMARADAPICCEDWCVGEWWLYSSGVGVLSLVLAGGSLVSEAGRRVPVCGCAVNWCVA